MTFDPYQLRHDFPMYEEHDSKFKGLPLVYLDNSATTFKPYPVIDAVNHYYKDITANTRRGDYSLAHEADLALENARKTVAAFLNAQEEEICFTSGDTMGMNEVAYGLLPFLKEGDEILLSMEEHASNVLPWFNVAKITKAVIRYIPFDENGRLTVENFKKSLTDRTKIVSLASVSNVLGYALPVKEFVALAHQKGAIYIDDAAQSVPHMKIDVKDSDVDFLAFSGHKMVGPTGTGVLYGKKEMLEKISPTFYGGEMNARFDSTGYLSLDDLPYRLEAGTQNVAGILGLAKACQYLENIGFDKIHEHELHLRRMAVEGLKKNGNAILYNEDADSGIVTFNIKDVFAQDVATYLSSKGVFVRSGQHCAKILPEYLKTQGTVRASFYLYNTEEDVKAFVKACSTAEDFLDAFFN
ncbi:MAG: aminotransferase class V-fold PLP-dependent enzyme [Candidatus Enterosoma sp.]|nr:cysteine desulfurase [Bacilli bacterium]MDD7181856.1 aminotransferase class V-fold PLP-dependent enzyme [Bacilli bacterium]MDY3048081.1 aminotransferase class V-fold PLP-dependent enzyme [Candidatus Enterosoma sp.]